MTPNTPENTPTPRFRRRVTKVAAYAGAGAILTGLVVKALKAASGSAKNTTQA